MTVSSDRNRRIQIHRRHGIVERPGLCLRHHEIHAIFDELIHRPWGAVRWNPAVDIREDKDAFIVEMDLPGVNTEEVRVVVEGAILAIEGQRQLGQSVEFVNVFFLKLNLWGRPSPHVVSVKII